MTVETDAKGRKLWVAPLRIVTSKLRRVAARSLAALVLATGISGAASAIAYAETRSLKLYFVHTGERATITYKRDGKFDPDGLAKLNRFLRDWRRNEPRKMDPRLFDLIWNVYQKTGSSDYINVLCGYRAPGTNEMLRTRSRHTGVAKESQHILGKAMDFYIPGVPLEKLREIGLKMQVGGVGYYPTSGSPFVHMDVGGVRAWPRASREVLARLFPDGKTIHLPPDGKPLPGYEAAMADYKRRMSSENIQIASSGGGRSRNLLQMLFGGGGDEDESPDAIADGDAPAAPAKTSKPATPTVQLASAEPAPQPKQTFIENIPSNTALPGVPNAPVPAVRPSLASTPQPDLETALVSPTRSAANDAMASVLQASDDGNPQYADLGQYKIPVPELLAERRLPGDAEFVAVPLPGSRPSFEIASASMGAGQDAGDLARPEIAPPSDIANTGDTPAVRDDEIAAMIRRMSPEVSDGQKAVPPSPINVTPANKPQQVAFAAPAPSAGAQLTRPMKSNLRPVLSAKAGEAKKGARPSKLDAIAALRGSRPENTALTGKMIEQWALAANHSTAAVPKPIDAVMRRDEDVAPKPEKVSTGEVQPSTAKFDASRFYGTSPAPVRTQ